MIIYYVSITPEVAEATPLPEGKIARYSRSHPHFLRNLLLDVAISLLLGVGIFQYYEIALQESAGVQNNRIGAVTLSASQLVAEIRSAHAVAYWLGPIAGSRYGLVISKTGSSVITYYSGGLGLENVKESRLIVKSSTRPNALRPLEDTGNQFNNTQNSTKAGRSYAYDKSFRDRVEITLPNRGGNVLIFYPSIRSPANIQLDVESLYLIS